MQPMHRAQIVTARPDEDFALVNQVLGGDARAFEELVRKHERRVFRVALAITGNQQDAEDAMQETFLKLYKRIGDFRRESRFATWLTSIAVNEALQLRLVRKRTDSFEEVNDAVELPTPSASRSGTPIRSSDLRGAKFAALWKTPSANSSRYTESFLCCVILKGSAPMRRLKCWD